MKNVLFLGSFVKSDNTGGSVGIDFILQNLKVEKVFWLNTRPKFKFTFLQNNLNIYENKKHESFLIFLINYFAWSFDFHFLRRFIFSQKVPSLISNLFLLFHLHIWTRFQLISVSRIIKNNKINHCFISLDNDFIIFSNAFLNYSKINNISIISDDPPASLRMYGVPDKTLVKIEKLFSNSLQMSNKIAVISEGMQIYYKNLYNVKSIITYPVNETKLLNSIEYKKIEKNQFQIIHIGHLRNSEIENLNIFIDALNLSNINYKFIFIGRNADRYNNININDKIKILGWVSQDDLEYYISESNFAYVPYSFNDNLKVFVTTSFPNKVTTFLKSGIPIIHHGPSNSSVSNFINKYKVGFNINSISNDEILNEIIKIYNLKNILDLKRRCINIAAQEIDSIKIANIYNEMLNA